MIISPFAMTRLTRFVALAVLVCNSVVFEVPSSSCFNMHNPDEPSVIKHLNQTNGILSRKKKPLSFPNGSMTQLKD